MDDIRGPLSRMKKKLNRLTGGKRKPDKTGANPDEETTDSTSSLPQPEPHVVAGKSYGREGDRANAAGEKEFSTDRLQPAREGDNGQGGEVADVDGEEVSQRHSHLHPDAEVTVGSERSGEPEGVHPSPSAPLISHGGKLDGT